VGVLGSSGVIEGGQEAVLSNYANKGEGGGNWGESGESNVKPLFVRTSGAKERGLKHEK